MVGLCGKSEGGSRPQNTDTHVRSPLDGMSMCLLHAPCSPLRRALIGCWLTRLFKAFVLRPLPHGRKDRPKVSEVCLGQVSPHRGETNYTRLRISLESDACLAGWPVIHVHGCANLNPPPPPTPDFPRALLFLLFSPPLLTAPKGLQAIPRRLMFSRSASPAREPGAVPGPQRRRTRAGEAHRCLHVCLFVCLRSPPARLVDCAMLCLAQWGGQC